MTRTVLRHLPRPDLDEVTRLHTELVECTVKQEDMRWRQVAVDLIKHTMELKRYIEWLEEPEVIHSSDNATI